MGKGKNENGSRGVPKEVQTSAVKDVLWISFGNAQLLGNGRLNDQKFKKDRAGDNGYVSVAVYPGAERPVRGRRDSQEITH